MNTSVQEDCEMFREMWDDLTIFGKVFFALWMIPLCLLMSVLMVAVCKSQTIFKEKPSSPPDGKAGK